MECINSEGKKLKHRKYSNAGTWKIADGEQVTSTFESETAMTQHDRFDPT